MTSTGPMHVRQDVASITANPAPRSAARPAHNPCRFDQVKPRTVRAYRTQKEARLRQSHRNEMSRVRAASACATPSMSSAMRMAGKLSWMSATRMMNASSRPPR